MLINKNYISFIILCCLFSCDINIKEATHDFDYYLNSKKIIINTSESNILEGEYIFINHIYKNEINTFIPHNINQKHWKIGWGNNKALEDNGCENIRAIDSINKKENKIYLGKLIRGTGYPKKNQPIVFWNFNADNFKTLKKKSILDLKKWKQFKGQSISFGGIKYDINLKKWILLFQECDNKQLQIYAAQSNNLTDWEPANNGSPILTYRNFKNISWAKGNVKEYSTPYVTDIIRHNDMWHLILSGKKENGIRNIGIACTKNNLLGPFQVIKKPILKEGILCSWNNAGCFGAKIQRKKNEFALVFDGVNFEKVEKVGIAFSRDLINWNYSRYNPVISDHTGWRSKPESSEPDYISWSHDSIILVVSGTKRLRQGFISHYITKNMYKGISGNVDDAQLGIYLSTDNGKHFYPHKNNPVIINDYHHPSENEHMGGNIQFIETDSMTYFFYQVKSNINGLKYSIHLKTRKK